MEEKLAKVSTFVPYISIEIIRIIFLNLPIKSLIRFQSVCKEWCTLIRDPDFQISYRGRRRVIAWLHKFPLKSITDNLCVEEQQQPLLASADLAKSSRFLGSCKGLSLLSIGSEIFLWNPSTRQGSKVVDLPWLKLAGFDVVSGLCYDASTRGFKAVLLLRNRFVFVDCRTKEWRLVQFPYNLRSAKGGIGFRNTLHLMVRKRIAFFDTSCDEFRLLPIPEPKYGGKWFIVGLGVLNDCLCIGIRRNGLIEVLVMEEYGVKESWVTAFVISNYIFKYNYQKLQFYSLQNKNLVLIIESSPFGDRILVYDQAKTSLDSVTKVGAEERFNYNDCTCVYVESFATPDGLVDVEG